MTKLYRDQPVIEPECSIAQTEFGAFNEVHTGSRLRNVTMGDYSYCDRYADIANTVIGKFSNIAAFTRIGPTDHPMHLASQHHFLYRTSYYWHDQEDWAEFFEHRASRLTHIGHDTWIGAQALILPEVTIGTGAVVAAGAVVTKDVAPYMIVGGVAAKTIKRRFSEHIAERMQALAWWDWSHDRLLDVLPDMRALPAEAFLEKYE
ncbi:MAG: chloramphenicol acetyltransferase [Pseudomonadota bacterium]